jgi:hypothetical protein
MVLHLVNWTDNKFERSGANEYYLAPVENVRVRFTTSYGKRVRRIGRWSLHRTRKSRKAARSSC